MFQIKVDFQIIKSYDPKVLLLWDTSRWSAIKNDPASIQIQYEDSAPVEGFFAKNRLNIIDSYRVFSEHDKVMPDGIYKITIKGSPTLHYKERYYYKTDLIRLEVDKLYLDAKTDEEKESLWKLEYLLLSIEALTRTSNIVEAKEAYELLNRMLSDYEASNKCKNC